MKHNFDELIKTDINLIEDSCIITGSYLCTWWNQSSTANQLGITGNGGSGVRDALDQDTIFGDENYYHIVPYEQRKNLIFLLDDGWDIPYGTPADADHRHYYGAVDPDKEKFSRFGTSPSERLKGISDKLKEMGYAGLGLWISPQECGLDEYIADDAKSYWEERAKWCDEAGVLYWKVDWGAHDYDDQYRKLISDCARRLAPGLLVEHAVIQMPCTHNNRSDNFLEERQNRVKYQMTFSDVYRTYDLLPPFENVCTLQRAHEALLAKSDEESSGAGLINAESQSIIAAGLGFTVGVMYYDDNMKACLNWQNISHPFGVHECNYCYSNERLTDSLFFEGEICEWYPCKHMTVYESAPAIMSRNCPLPEVKPCSSESPFVVASKNPENGAYAVAAVRRTIDPNQSMAYLADVTVSEADLKAPIGVFGNFNSLTICFNEEISANTRILVQDLTGSFAYDATEYVKFDSSRISFDGKLLRYLGKSSRPRNNSYEPTLVLKLITDEL